MRSPATAETRPASAARSLQQRADAAGFHIDDPELPIPRTIRHEGHMAAVGCPGWIFVPPDRGELPHRARPHVEDEHLQGAATSRWKATVWPSGDHSGALDEPVAP